jgi:hypothetical protein
MNEYRLSVIKRQIEDELDIRMKANRHNRIWAVLAAATLLMGAAASHAKSNLEGTWLVSKPQTLLVPADGSPVPFTAAGRKTYEKNRSSAQGGDLAFDQTIQRCASPGIPRLMFSPKRFKIFERPGKVLFLFEWNHLVRQIDMRDDATIENSQALGGTGNFAFDLYGLEDTVGAQVGHSRGHWDGSTLIAETDHFVDFKMFDGLIQTSDQLKLAERIRLTDENTLEYRATITDPATFTKPWDAVLTYKRQPDAPLAEDLCLERKRSGQSTWPKPLAK